MKKDVLIILAVVLLIFTALASVVIHYERKLRDSELRLKAATGTVTVLRNQYNESVAERQSFEGTRAQLKDEVARWKKAGDTLRSEVGRKTGQIALLKSELNFKASGKTKVIRDTVNLPGETVTVRDTYEIDTANRFISLRAVVNATDYNIDLKIKELDVEFATDTKRRGLFGPEYTTVTAISRNPYVENKDLKSVTLAKKRPLIGKAAILAAGVLVGLLIK